MSPPSFSEASKLAGEVIEVCVGGEVRGSGTPFFDFFRLAKVRSALERAADNSVCQHCGQKALVVFQIAWESGYDDAKANEACEHCAVGRVTAGSEAFSFKEEF